MNALQMLSILRRVIKDGWTINVRHLRNNGLGRDTEKENSSLP